jgi:hypothetical protein
MVVLELKEQYGIEIGTCGRSRASFECFWKREIVLMHKERICTLRAGAFIE